MNPHLTFEIDFSFFSSVFSLLYGEQEKKEITEDKLITQKNSNASFKSTFVENKNELTNKKDNKFKKKNNYFIMSIKEDSNEENILSKDKIDKEKNLKNHITEDINKKGKKTKDELCLFLVYYIKNVYIFRKKVKLLIKNIKIIIE